MEKNNGKYVLLLHINILIAIKCECDKVVKCEVHY